MSLEYVPVRSKSSKAHQQEELAESAADMSMQFIPYSAKASKPAAKSSKAPNGGDEPSTDDIPAKAKSSKSIAIAPRSITLGEKTDTQVSEANSEASGADDTRKMSAVSVAVVGAMLFLWTFVVLVCLILCSCWAISSKIGGWS